MSEPENFIARWSRRKRDAAEDATKVPTTPGPAGERAQEPERVAANERAKSGPPTASPRLDASSVPAHAHAASGHAVHFAASCWRRTPVAIGTNRGSAASWKRHALTCALGASADKN